MNSLMDNEAMRFALGLRAGMRRPEREFGNGFSNTVLIDLIKEGDLNAHKEIADILKRTYVYGARRDAGLND
jgi:hypothetical protein